MYKLYQIAGVVMRVSVQNTYTLDMFKKYEYFGNEPFVEEINLSFEEFKNDCNNLPDFPECYVENLALLKKIMKVLILNHNAMLFHGSSICYNGNAFIFTAPSGTGKSTHTRLLKELLKDKVEYINDDKPIIKLEGENVMVYGSPWNGKHELGDNISAPLKAICLVTRGENNIIIKIPKLNMLKFLFEQAMGFDDSETAEKVLDVISKIIEKTNFYMLSCNMDISAAECSLRGMLNED